MKSESTLYPSLGRYFSTVQDLADAACVSRYQATKCLKGQASFTKQQKRAIANDIIARFCTGEIAGVGKANEIEDLIDARKNFDQVFKN